MRERRRRGEGYVRMDDGVHYITRSQIAVILVILGLTLNSIHEALTRPVHTITKHATSGTLGSQNPRFLGQITNTKKTRRFSFLNRGAQTRQTVKTCKVPDSDRY